MFTFHDASPCPTRAVQIIVVALSVWGMGSGPSALEIQDSEVITMEGPGRILAPAVQQFEKRCHCVVTYEDNKWRQDEVQVSPGFQRRRPDEPMILLPKAIPFNFSVSRQIESQPRAQIAISLRELLAAYENNNNMGRFRLVEGTRAFHIVPKTNAIFDVPVTLEAGDWSVQAVVSAIAVHTSQATGNSVGLASGATNLMSQTQVRMEGQTERAGELLSRALAATGRKLSWLLLYDFGMKQYFLNIHFVE